MPIVGRSKIDHPSLGTVGGSTLHAQIENIYTNIGNHLAGRYFAFATIANNTTSTIDHNFGAPFADYKVYIYTGSHPSLTRVSNPSASGWTIIATPGFERTRINVTTPATGGPHTFAVFMTQGRGAEILDDLDDVLIASTPSDNAILVYDAANSRWIPSSAFVEGVLLPRGTSAQRPAASDGIIRYNTDTSSYEGYSAGAWSSLGGGGTVDRVTQASHAFVVGDILYLNGSVYTKAIATASNTAEVVGMVSRVVDANTFEMTISGEVTGLSGLVVGEAYFLSPTVAGTMSVTEPTTLGHVSLPLGVASSTTSFYVTLKRGSVVGGTNARTQISLQNNTTAIIQDVSAFEAGQLTGWIYIDASTDLRFFVSAPFARNGANTDWNISPSYMGDTPPAGFSISITSAGVIRYTMPLVTGFSAANINYALNAPAVGATFPLSIDASTIQSGTIAAARLASFVPTQTRYTSGSGTYNVPSGVKWLRIRMVGGGGGGGGGSTANGGGGGAGGGAGGYCESVISSPNATYSYAVGSGGAGGAGGAAGANGNAGNNTTFSTFTASGGGLGTGAPNTASGNGGSPAGSGGSASGANINMAGGGGSAGYVGQANNYGGSGGAGGNSAFGSGGASVFANSNGNAGGTNSGAGGSGGGGGSTAGTGGAGAAGIIIIDEYYY